LLNYNPSQIAQLYKSDEEQEASEIDVEPEMEKLVGELEQGMEKVQRAKQISLVRKGDVLLLSAVGSDGCNFGCSCVPVYAREMDPSMGNGWTE